jgi:hypothetical protein
MGRRTGRPVGRPRRDDYDNGPDPAAIDCICPKCGGHHRLAFRWAGRGTPRKFCKPCRRVIYYLHEDMEPHELHINIRRAEAA